MADQLHEEKTESVTHLTDSIAMSPSSTDVETSFPRSKINVLLMEKIHADAVKYLVDSGYTVETADLLSKAELIEKLQYTHVIGVRSKTKLTTEVVEAAKNLMAVGCFCIGTDQTDLETTALKGIPVFNSPFANTRSVAELVVAQIVCLARRVGDQNRWMHDGIWRKTAKGCFEVRGKTLGIVGYGHVGSQLSILAEGMGMKVIYYDIIPKLPLGNASSVGSMRDILTKSNFVSLHVPYTEDTKSMIGEEQIALMRPGSYLLNAARGKCVDIKAVAAALKSGHLAGAYFDVYPSEPTDDTMCLVDCPNTILTPHIGGSTQEAQASIAVEVAQKLQKFIDEGSTIAAVNFPEVSLKANPHVHRLLHVHKNVPGVMRKVMELVYQYNISAQSLQSTRHISYLLVDLDADKPLSRKVKKELDKLEETISTRIVYCPGAI
jgi:D-3-phosphoglycerate dehydrogenase